MKNNNLLQQFTSKPIPNFLFMLFIAVNLLISTSAYSQILSSQVIASSGGYYSNAAGSLSFTIGETNTQSLSSATHMLTQGFQQSFKLHMTVKAFIQGYYKAGGLMENVLFQQGVLTSTFGYECDSIQVELRRGSAPYQTAFQRKTIIKTNGDIDLDGVTVGGQPYYIVLVHRNGLETWSANPIIIDDYTEYDFRTAANKAYGNNQVEVETNVYWAIYNGDIDQNDAVDNIDFSIWEADANAFATGYLSSDLNGDGSVDNSDFSIWETNSNGFVSLVKP
jgi:hypothetical protein